jgi:hypothetical protein
MKIQGHNNKTYSSTTNQAQSHKIGNLTVTGHNNRFENLIIIGQLVVTGHNNIFTALQLVVAPGNTTFI